MPENLTALLKSENLKKKAEQYLWKGFSKVFNKARIVTTPTETGVRLIKSRLAVKVMAISSGIDLANFNSFGNAEQARVKYNISAKNVLLYVGRLDPEKNIEQILEAVAKASRRADFQLVIVGRGISERGLKERCFELNISSSVVFTGFVPDEDLPSIYKLSRCFIIASTAELLSLSTLQGMASGLPVIAVNAGALHELVKEGENGYLFQDGDIKAIAAHVEMMMEQDVLCDYMGQKSVEIAETHDINDTVHAFEKLYKAQLVNLPATFPTPSCYVPSVS